MSDHVEVIGSGTASAVPDVVVLDARVQCEATDVAGALGAATGRVATALQAVADHGVAAADRRTTGLGVSTRWDHDGHGVSATRPSRACGCWSATATGWVS